LQEHVDVLLTVWHLQRQARARVNCRFAFGSQTSPAKIPPPAQPPDRSGSLIDLWRLLGTKKVTDARIKGQEPHLKLHPLLEYRNPCPSHRRPSRNSCWIALFAANLASSCDQVHIQQDIRNSHPNSAARGVSIVLLCIHKSTVRGSGDLIAVILDLRLLEVFNPCLRRTHLVSPLCA
jgi:hypothetical protein